MAFLATATAMTSSSAIVLRIDQPGSNQAGGLTPALANQAFRGQPSSNQAGGLTPVPANQALCGLTQWNVGQIQVTVKEVPGIGHLCMMVPGNSTLDDVKHWVTRQMAERNVVILRGDWGFHSPFRSTPFNMPVGCLRVEDQPLKFSWHEWSESYQRAQPSPRRG